MAHANQERYGKMVDAKLRTNLVTRDNYIFNNKYEGDPKAGKVKIPVRDTEVEVKDYDKANGVDPKASTTTYEKFYWLDRWKTSASQRHSSGFSFGVFSLY